MNAYNPLSSMKRLEGAGLPRQHAEAIASEISDGTRDYVTKAQLDASLDKLLIKLGIMTSGIVALACTIMGVVFSVK